jgi:hypothetical protein
MRLNASGVPGLMAEFKQGAPMTNPRNISRVAEIVRGRCDEPATTASD